MKHMGKMFRTDHHSYMKVNKNFKLVLHIIFKKSSNPPECYRRHDECVKKLERQKRRILRILV